MKACSLKPEAFAKRAAAGGDLCETSRVRGSGSLVSARMPETLHILDLNEKTGPGKERKSHRRDPLDRVAKNAIGPHGDPPKEISNGLETDKVIAAIQLTAGRRHPLHPTRQKPRRLRRVCAAHRHRSRQPSGNLPGTGPQYPEHPFLQIGLRAAKMNSCGNGLDWET